MNYRNLSDIQSDLDINLNALHYCILLKENGQREFNITAAKSSPFSHTDKLIHNRLFLSKNDYYHLQACRIDFRRFIERVQCNGVIDLKTVYSKLVEKRRELKREKRRTISYSKCPRFKEKEDARIAQLRKPKTQENINIYNEKNEVVSMFLKAGRNDLTLINNGISISVFSTVDITLKVEI